MTKCGGFDAWSATIALHDKNERQIYITFHLQQIISIYQCVSWKLFQKSICKNLTPTRQCTTLLTWSFLNEVGINLKGVPEKVYLFLNPSLVIVTGYCLMPCAIDEGTAKCLLKISKNVVARTSDYKQEKSSFVEIILLSVYILKSNISLG